jgi:hypothetical protein
MTIIRIDFILLRQRFCRQRSCGLPELRLGNGVPNGLRVFLFSPGRQEAENEKLGRQVWLESSKKERTEYTNPCFRRIQNMTSGMRDVKAEVQFDG